MGETVVETRGTGGRWIKKKRERSEDLRQNLEIMNHLKSITESNKESSSQPSNGMASPPRVIGQTLPCCTSDQVIAGGWGSSATSTETQKFLCPSDTKLPRNLPYISSLLLDIW